MPVQTPICDFGKKALPFELKSTEDKMLSLDDIKGENGTLAVFVSTQLFDEMVYIVPTAAYALVMMATSLFFVYIVKKSS